MKLWDSLQQKKIIISDQIITMYLCGPTVYNDIHIGNLRPVIVFDILQRLFKFTKQKYFYIQNITDIDDKIINQAKLKQVSESKLADKYTKNYLNILQQLNIFMPSKVVKVSENIIDIVNFIQKLINKKVAYVSNNSVYFSFLKKNKFYGQLSHTNVFSLQVAKRTTFDKYKKSSNDFVLWKSTNEGQKWQSFWGDGRPGWHTECALFLEKYFSLPVTIHGGGVDLKFPHHENERIQLLALNSQEPVKIWLHNGHLLYNDEKMSKSLNNMILVKDFLKKYSSLVLRYLLSITHYSKPLKINSDMIEQANNQVKCVYQMLKLVQVHMFLNKENLNDDYDINIVNEVIKALQDDLNFSNAWFIVEKLITMINQNLKNSSYHLQKLFNTLKNCFFILGWEVKLPVLTDEIKNLLKKWSDARESKQYRLADQIRNELQNKDIL